jgi:hypothetical protein
VARGSPWILVAATGQFGSIWVGIGRGKAGEVAKKRKGEVQ